MTVAEYIIDFLKRKGVDTAFVITGGQVMYLNDALYRTPEIKTIFVHHEQTASMSADAYSRSSGKLGLAVVTAGPGAVNALSGLVGGYVDSAPMMIISGLSDTGIVDYMKNSGIRQYGVQGINTQKFVENGTKYFASVDDPAKIEYYTERAYYTVFDGRPGPVWLEIPLDIQGMTIPDKMLYPFSAIEIHKAVENHEYICNKIINVLTAAKRPLIVAGQGIRLAGVTDDFLQFIENNRLPVVTTRLGIDLIEYDHPLFVGHPGNYGDRPANITVQNADVIVVLGSRMSASSVGHNAGLFGRNADIYVVDIDDEELKKPGVNIREGLCGDLRVIIPELLKHPINCNISRDNWISFCIDLKYKYPVMQPEYKTGDKINSYYLIDVLCSVTDSKTSILVDSGSCFHVASQGWKIKKGQRFLTTGGLSSMGYWCAVIGACAANNYGNTIAITGDGSLQMNIQELATIKYLDKPIKIFVINNEGYLLIRQVQRKYLDNRFFGESIDSGVYCPDTMSVAGAYGIKGIRIENADELEDKLRETLEYNGPVICEVMCLRWQDIIPRVSVDKLPDGMYKERSFEDMYPYLSKEELAACMIDSNQE